MKKIICLLFVFVLAGQGYAQDNIQSGPRFGIKGGYNWSYVTAKGSGFSPHNQSGFMAALFFSPQSKKGIGYRTELVFSRQGYSFDNGGQNTGVLNDYIYLPQLTTFNIGKLIQLQAGAQIGFLLHSKLSSGKDSSITNLMNRIDYGFAAGLELNPVKGLLIGGRYNLGLGKLYKQYENAGSNPYPLPFNPETTDLKNGVIQFFIGYRF